MSKQTPQFWASAEQLNNDPEFLASAQQEFHPLTVEEMADAGENGSGMQSNRRDFLKMLGFSLGAATIAACDIPVRKAIPYSIRPDEIVPGVANYYATSFVNGGDYCAILAKTREGRPIKIEGNALSQVTKGGTSARTQALVLSLYDTYRLRQPGKVNNGEFAASNWAELDQEIKGALASSSNIRVVTQTQMSPSLDAAMKEFAAKYEGKVKFVVYDPISSSAALDFYEEELGIRAFPDFHFDKAKTIVGIDCDFLGSWVSPVEYAADYATRRKAVKMKDASKEMSRHIQFEGHMSLTGSNADNRVLIKPSEMGLAVAKLFNAVAEKIGGTPVSVPSGTFSWAKADAAIKKAAEALVASRDASLVVCGVNDKAIQTLVYGINMMIGAFENTMHFAHLSRQRQGSDSAIKTLVDELGSVDAIFFYNCNPVYDLPALAEQFKQKLGGVKLSVSLNGTLNETAKLCKIVAPDHHVLESWGDVEPKAGHYSLIQPTIRPLFDTRQAGHSFLVWGESANLDAASEQPFYEYVKKQWEATAFSKSTESFATFTGFWDQCVHDGVFSFGIAAASPQGIPLELFSTAAAALKAPATGTEAIFYETVNIGNGSYANNPWLQEMPDPIMRTTWGNFISIPIKYDEGGNRFDGSLGDLHDLKDGDIVKVSIGGAEREFTVLRQFGLHPGTVAIGLGYGREAAGPAGNAVGVNVYPMVKFEGQHFAYHAADVQVSGKTGRDEWFACVQLHHTYGIQTDASKTTDAPNVDETALGYRGFQGSLTKRSVLFAATASDLVEKQEALARFREEAQELNTKGLYPDYSEQYARGHFWGMSIDLSACIGCGACQVACVSENNVPMVGKREVARSHEMTWLRIDRYFYGNEETPNTAYMPLMCQHCQNAPCENVCPVNATNHSFEGMNQMAYNRCIGTRYCANNCPFKVRRFNWLDFTAADLFPWNEHNLNSADSDKETLLYIADNLTRMVLNPDVTVRSRGVIEKCSLCVQRIQAGKLTSKVEGRKLEDGDVKTACQTACPTGAIVFGDRNDPKSELMSLWETPLNYIALEEVNVRPTVTYLMKVTNGEDTFYNS